MLLISKHIYRNQGVQIFSQISEKKKTSLTQVSLKMLTPTKSITSTEHPETDM